MAALSNNAIQLYSEDQSKHYKMSIQAGEEQVDMFHTITFVKTMISHNVMTIGRLNNNDYLVTMVSEG